MPRPSLRAQRREQILNAAMSCVAMHGVSGLTLEKVAEIAGVARPLIRHNVGNREQLLEGVAQRFVESSNEQVEQLKNISPHKLPLSSTIDYLFDLKSADTTLMLVAEALIAESANDQKIAKVMHEWLTRFVNVFEALAKQEFPEATTENCSIVATGITGIYFTVDSLKPIHGLVDFTGYSKKAALLLLDQLCELNETRQS